MTLHRNKVADQARLLRKRQTIEGFKSMLMLHRIRSNTHTIEKFKRMNLEKSFDARLLLHSKGDLFNLHFYFL